MFVHSLQRHSASGFAGEEIAAGSVMTVTGVETGAAVAACAARSAVVPINKRMITLPRFPGRKAMRVIDIAQVYRKSRDREALAAVTYLADRMSALGGKLP